jgi:Spy/CpxP family protein refolding chaperone
MRQRMCGVVLGAWCAIGVATVHAQSSDPQGPPPPVPQLEPQGRGGRAGQRDPDAVQPPGQNVAQAQQQVQEQWNVLVLRQSQRMLALTDEQFPMFFLKMQSLQDVRDQHQRMRRRTLGELIRLTSETPGADDATLAAKVKELGDRDAEARRREQDALAAVDAVLTPRQRARFRVFEDQMDRRKLEMLAAVFRNIPGGVPPRGAGRGGGEP